MIDQFFKKHLSQMFIIEKIQREELWEIPFVVLREAVLNAFLHADYSQTGTCIHVSYF